MAIIGVDIGTTSTKTVAFNEMGHVVYQVSHGYPLIAKLAKQAEEKPQDIFKAVTLGLKEVIEKIGKDKIKGIGFSSAMHTLILMDNDNKPLTNVFTWADNRAVKTLKKHLDKDNLEKLTKYTGVPLHPMLPLAKLLWIKENNKRLWNKTAHFIDIKSYVLYQFTQQYYVDYSIANASGLFNAQEKKWDKNILRYLNITENQLPKLVDTTYQIFSSVKKLDIPLIIGGSDGALANLSNPLVPEPFYTISFGTSAAVRTTIQNLKLSSNRKLFTYYQYKNNWVMGAPTNNAGDVWKWLKDNILNLKTYDDLDAQALQSSAGAHKLFFIPYIFGERAPIWDANAFGGLVGLNSFHTSEDIVRAVIEGIIYNTDLIIGELNKSLEREPSSLVLVGGMARDELFDQLLADITGYKVYIPSSVETSALGAAILAMISLNMVDAPNKVQTNLSISKVFVPSNKRKQIYFSLKKKWREINKMYLTDFVKE